MMALKMAMRTPREALGLVLEAPGGKVSKTYVLLLKSKGARGGPGILRTRKVEG